MAYEFGPDVQITLVAGADLSLQQYHFVKLNASGQAVAVAAATDKAIGILQNNPTLGGEALVVVVGGSKMVASAAMAVGDAIGTSATGTGVTVVPGTDITKFNFGQVLTAASAANDIITAVINCASAGRAA